MWATYVPISVFLGLSVLDLGPMYAIDVRRRQTEVRRASLLNAPIPQGGAWQQPITAVEREQHSGHAAPKQPPTAQNWACAIGRLLRRWAIHQQRSAIGWSRKSVKCAQHRHPSTSDRVVNGHQVRWHGCRPHIAYYALWSSVDWFQVHQ